MPERARLWSGRRPGARPVLGGGDVFWEELTVADAFTQVVGADVDVLACVEGSGGRALAIPTDRRVVLS